MQIKFVSGATINYIYDANGKKLSKKVLSAGAEVLTEYQGAFQYAGGVLDFIQTAEGYVKRSMRLTTPVFNYMYNYKDHLGNVRVSFSGTARDPKIMEENHYYPFGLKHEKYNSDTYEFVELAGTDGYYTGIELAEPNVRNSYQYKFQEQERQDELGLNWDFFKWRNYDFAIGRFMNIDPLAEKFAYNGVYNFSENKVIHARELEGLEAVEINKGVDNLVIVALGRAGGMSGDGIKNGQTLYSALEKNGFKDNGLNKLSKMSSMSNSRVLTYAGSDGAITASHIAQTIENYRNTNPNGTVSLIGHSLGGKAVLDAANLVNDNDEIKNKTINLVMTLEAASTKGVRGSSYETNLGDNVLNILNFNSAQSSYSGGGGNSIGTSNVSTVRLPSGTNHTNMDNTLTPYVPSILNNMYSSGTAKYNDDVFKNIKVIPNDENSSY